MPWKVTIEFFDGTMIDLDEEFETEEEAQEFGDGKIDMMCYTDDDGEEIVASEAHPYEV